MAQFASTLYPQTNPSNPILLEFRSSVREQPRFTSARIAAHWTKSRANWAICSEGASSSQRKHAHRVLTRLAALTG